jgi:hypothetical protein
MSLCSVPPNQQSTLSQHSFLSIHAVTNNISTTNIINIPSVSK